MSRLIVTLAIIFNSMVLVAAEKFPELDHRVPANIEKLPVLVEEWQPDPYEPKCQVRRLAVPYYSPVDKQLLEIYFLLVNPRGAKKIPAVVILPNTYGPTAIEGDLTTQLCRHNFAVAFMDGPRNYPANLQQLVDFMRDEVLSARALMDFLDTLPEVRTDRVGVIGISYGGIMLGPVLGADDRIRAGVVVAGGGDIPSILSKSVNTQAEAFRTKIMKQFGLSNLSEFEARLKAQPGFFNNIDSKFELSKKKGHVLQFVVQGDNTVPTSNQLTYWNAFGQPQRTLITVSGLLGGIATTFSKEAPHVLGIKQFLDRHLTETVQFLNARIR